MADYALYTLKVSTLTPLHIGSGHDLLNEYDYAIYSGQTWRINETALLDARNVDDLRLADQLAQTRPAQLLTREDYHPGSPYFRYVIKGVPRSQAEGAQLREQLKDTFDQPYLPGSSLKGALRTALAWHAWAARKLSPEISRLDRRKEWAARSYERELLGSDPNHDLLRALHVQDSLPLNTDRLMIVNVRVLSQHSVPASPIELEAVRSDSAFEMGLKIDQALLGEWAAKNGLRLAGSEWLRDLPSVVMAHTRQQIADEMAWFKALPNAKSAASFYQTLNQARLSANQFLLQLGWGTGWNDKTFGSRLQADEQFMERLIVSYNLARGRREHGDPFPKSRRLTMRFQDAQGQRVESPAYPLGWVLVEMIPLQR